MDVNWAGEIYIPKAGKDRSHKKITMNDLQWKTGLQYSTLIFWDVWIGKFPTVIISEYKAVLTPGEAYK